ncbi:diguanylate cyclase [Aestuariispira ectoiniformans]|uniref:diguanylate cyclase n=1 Tax=Aestuariispira ectoiniformans TaxID=2775080 RepID=UPI00223B5251|nr:diguanylate cyclase [Aestuariispira ectoiniformans]
MAPTRKDPFSSFPATAQDVLKAMDRALDDHRLWLQQWHRAIVCHQMPPENITADDPVLQTRLGLWLSAHRGQGLLKQAAFADLERCLAEFCEFGRMLALRAPDGKPVPTEDYDAFVGRADDFVFQARRIQDAFRKAVSELDPLTGLHNRHVMMQELAAEYDRAVRNDGQCCIALADLDHFKRVNDSHGHAVGDQVLAAAAGRFLSRLRPYDSIYRYGGEEFLIMLPNSNPGTAVSVLERLRHALADRPIVVEGGARLSVTASFGIASLGSGVSLKSIIEQADTALYRAKESGRNKVCVWAGEKDD